MGTKLVIEANIIYINKVLFLFTMSRKLEFLTIQHIKNQSQDVYVQAMDNVLGLYNTRGMRVTDLFVDPEFESAKSKFEQHGIRMNVASASEHVAGIERKTRVLKERIRSRWSRLPYKAIP